jgi:hypothetical protein
MVASRLLGLANVIDGMSSDPAAHQPSVDRGTLRDWVLRFNAERVDGLRDRPRSGRPPWLNGVQLAALKTLVLRGSRLAPRGDLRRRPGAPRRSAMASAAPGDRAARGLAPG